MSIGDVVLIGAGSYVVGDSLGDGVLIPSLLYLQKENKIDKIKLVVRSKRGKKFWAKFEEYCNKLNCKGRIEELIIGDFNQFNFNSITNSVCFLSIPDPVHYSYLKKLIKKGIPTWVVKPLTGNIKESLEIVELSNSKNIPVWVDYHKRFDLSNKKLKTYINYDKFGQLNFYSVQYSQPHQLPLKDLVKWSSEVDVFQYIGCHYIDQIFYFYPIAKPLRISATGIKGNLKKNNGPEYDIVNALIDFKLSDNHILRTNFVVGWNDPVGSTSKSHQKLDLQFDNSRIIVDQKVRGFQLWGQDKTSEINPYFFEIIDEGEKQYCTGYGFKSVELFLKYCQLDNWSKYETLPWAYNAFKTDEVLDYSKKSLANNGEWVFF